MKGLKNKEVVYNNYSKRQSEQGIRNLLNRREGTAEVKEHETTVTLYITLVWSFSLVIYCCLGVEKVDVKNDLDQGHLHGSVG